MLLTILDGRPTFPLLSLRGRQGDGRSPATAAELRSSVSAAIEAHGITRIYRGSRKRVEVRAVDRVDLRIEQGEVVALLGPNGAGKTTMVRVLACLLRPTDGAASVCGYGIREQPDTVRAVCGLSTETPGLYEQLTAAQYLTFFARMYLVPEREIAPRVDDQLRSAGLWDRRADRLGTFSKGMRQKINIARALVHRPRVVFLDEPTSGLDVEAARSIREHIQELSQDADTTFLICTHNLSEAERLCGRIAVMNRGRIVATGSPQELKDRVFGGRALRIRLRQALPQHRDLVASLPGVEQAELENSQILARLSAAEEEVNPGIVRALVAVGADIISLSTEGRSLEDLYLRLVHSDSEELEQSP